MHSDGDKDRKVKKDRGTPGRVVAEAKKDYRKVLTKEDGFDIIAKLSEKQRRARRSRASEERISEKAAP